MLKRQSEIPANIRQPRRADTPFPTGLAHRADKPLSRHVQTRNRATRVQYATVKAGVVRDEVFGPVEQRAELWPDVGEDRGAFHLRPGNVVQVSEANVPPRRANQAGLAGDD